MPYDDDEDAEDVIVLGAGADDDEDEEFEPDLGPDERDMDLIDGSWEQQYYAGQTRSRDWHSIQVGLALLALLGITIPGFLVLFR